MITATERRSPGFGLSLDPARICLVGDSGLDDARTHGAPPAIILPSLRREPARLDGLHGRTTARGTGLPWPPRAAVGDQRGSLRFPLGFAWPLFLHGGDARWTATDGDHPDDPKHLSAAEALSVAATATLSAASASSTIPAALVIPNALREQQQDQLLSALGQRGAGRIQLLWRPVAGALAWCAREDERRGAAADQPEGSLGHVLVLHCGLDGLEATVLEIVAQRAQGRVITLPARPRPTSQPETVFGLALAHELTERCFGESRQLSPKAVWRLLWCSSWLQALCGLASSTQEDRNGWSDRLRLEAELAGVGLPKRHQVESIVARVLDDLVVSARGGDLRIPRSLRWTSEQCVQRSERRAAPKSIGSWIAHCRERLPRRNLSGVIVTGAFASIRAKGEALGQYLAARLAGPQTPILLTQSPLERDLLAQGAGEHIRRLTAGLPTYLDTLPRVDVLISRRGEPEWLPLLQEEDKYVEGGRPWRRNPDLEGPRIARGRDELVLDLAMDESPTAREVTTTFSQPTTQPEAIRLRVSLLPANGSARVEVIPTRPGALGRRRVLVDWGRMRDLGQTPQEVLRSFPRAFPPLNPRDSSPYRWTILRERLRAARGAIASSPRGRETRRALERVREAAREADSEARQRSQLLTAVASDGVPPGAREPLDAFYALAKRIMNELPENTDEFKHLVASCGYCSADFDEFLELLRSRIQRGRHDRETMIAAGNCFRTPEDSKRLVEASVAVLSGPPTGINETLKALGRLLRYRADALKLVTSRDCERLARSLADVIERQLDKGKGAYIFRNACLCVLFLLRRRRYSDGGSFMAPDSPLAVRIKGLFERARDAARARTLELLGGVVNQAAVFQMLIDYVDRRGRGLPEIPE